MAKYILMCEGSIAIPRLTAEIREADDQMALDHAMRVSQDVTNRSIYRFSLVDESDRVVAFWRTEEKAQIRNMTIDSPFINARRSNLKGTAQ